MHIRPRTISNNYRACGEIRTAIERIIASEIAEELAK